MTLLKSFLLPFLRTRRSQWLLLLVFLALLARLLPGPRTIDDAFITFRYARSLLEGNGLVFNPGEQVLGTTTPLYALLMAGLGVLSGGAGAPFPVLAVLVNTLADAGTCLLLVRMGTFRPAGAAAPLARWAGWAAAFAWAVAPFSVTFAIGGLETSLYVFFLTGMAAAALEQRRVTAALLAALALLTRPDALILIGLLGLERLAALLKPVQRSSGAWKWEALVFGLPVLGWGLYASLAYGSPLPHSIAAKTAAYLLNPGDALIRLIQHYATPFLEWNWLGSALAVGIGLLVYPLLAVLGTRRAARVSLRLLPWTLYPWFYLVTFALPNPLIFRWYLTPPLPAYFFVIFLGLEWLAEGLKGKFNPGGPQPAGDKKNIFLKLCILGAAGIPILSFILALSPVAGDWRGQLDHGPQGPAPEMAFIKLELLYRQAADLIAPQMTARTVLAAGDVGVLGFYTPARILDTVGLNSPISTSYYPLPPADYVINYAIPARLLLDQAPDWVVVLEAYGRRTFLQDAEFLRRYQLFKKIETDMYGSDGLLIFKAVTK